MDWITEVYYFKSIGLWQARRTGTIMQLTSDAFINILIQVFFGYKNAGGVIGLPINIDNIAISWLNNVFLISGRPQWLCNLYRFLRLYNLNDL